MNNTHKFPLKLVATKARWPEQQVLAVAREKARALMGDGQNKQLQAELAAVLVEAGWTEEEFIDVLCKDLIAKSKK